jgi:hypothetical protein
MRPFPNDPSLRSRIRAAYWLAGAAALLGMLLLLGRAPTTARGIPPGPATAAAIAEGVDTLLDRYGVDRSLIRTRRILSPAQKPVRIEQQIAVVREFPTLLANDQLQELLAPAGARVLGTERTREGIVTLHVVTGGFTTRSLIFILGAIDTSGAGRQSNRRKQ